MRKNRNVKYYLKLQWFDSTSTPSLLWAKSGALWCLSLTLRTLPSYRPRRTHPFLPDRRLKPLQHVASPALLHAENGFPSVCWCHAPALCPARWALSGSGRNPELHGSGWGCGTVTLCACPGVTALPSTWGLHVLPVLLQGNKNSSQGTSGSSLAPFKDMICPVAP